MNLYPGFFTGIEAALFNSVVVLVYSVFEKRPDTINIYTLLRNLDKSLSQDQKLAFEQQVSIAKSTWIKISILRNEQVGHQALYQAPENTFSKAQVSPEEIRELITCAQQLTAEISSTVFRNILAFNVESKPDLKTSLAALANNKCACVVNKCDAY
jgi:hypothetical protein